MCNLIEYSKYCRDNTVVNDSNGNFANFNVANATTNLFKLKTKRYW